MLARHEQEQQELDRLAPYASRARDAQRPHPESEHDYRSAYQRDRDRVVHSTAFRRLEYKTQVFVNHEGDHYRTRLTHTLEVAQISRTIARAMRLNEDLVEAIALAHDLGHGPFGHACEDELAAMMSDCGGFNHNRQGLRTVDLLEHRAGRLPGLNLTNDVREGFLKHDASVGIAGIPSAANVHLEAQVVAHADHIAYNSHDADDGMESGLIGPEELARNSRLWAGCLEKVGRQFPELTGEDRRRVAVRRLIGEMVRDTIETSEAAIREAGVEGPADARRHPERLVGFSPAMATRVRELELFLHDNLYRHHRINRMMAKSRRFVRMLFEAFVGEGHELLNPRWLQFMEQQQQEHGLTAEVARKRIVCDYLAGMTDRYAHEMMRRLFTPVERM
jgi:dGTPase